MEFCPEAAHVRTGSVQPRHIRAIIDVSSLAHRLSTNRVAVENQIRRNSIMQTELPS